MSRDTRERYGLVSRLFHWGIALLVVWQLLKILDRVADGEHWIGQTLVPYHVSIGVLILVLAVFRAGWAFAQRRNRPEAPEPMAFLVRAGHLALYACLLLMPLTGIAIMVGNGYGLKVFGMQLVARGDGIDWLADLGGILHSPLAWLLLVLVVGHAGMALVHHVVKKDGVLRRML